MFKIFLDGITVIFGKVFWDSDKSQGHLPKENMTWRNGWILALYIYRQDGIRDLVWKMKYRSDRTVAMNFSQKIFQIIQSRGWQDHILVPIPMHWRRRIERGFNQCQWLISGIQSCASEAGFKIQSANALKRKSYSKKQSWSNRDERLANALSIYDLKKSFLNTLKNKKVLLIDDVVTTGATLIEARRAILKARPEIVRAITVAG